VLVTGSEDVGGPTPRCRDHSKDGLQVRAHDSFDTIDSGEGGQGLKVRFPLALSEVAKGLNCDVNPDFVPVLETIGDGLLGRIDSDWHAINLSDVDAGTKRRL